MRRMVGLLVCAVAAAALAPACGGGSSEPPVATPTLSLSRDRVPIGSPVQLTYTFVVADNATFDGDYLVFVHVLETEGEQLWTDDHPPAIPTSQWKPGQTVRYTRTRFVPNYPYIGEAVVRLGLYSPSTGKRLALSAEEAGRSEYVVTRFQLLPQSENIFLIYKDGWHPAEVAADNPASEWQWTKKSATISFRNPRKDVTFYLEYDARSDRFPTPQRVTLRAGGQVFAAFGADSRDPKLLTFSVTADQLGSGDVAEITLEVDGTFAPGGADPRELGIRVFHAFVEPK